jgi:Phage Connector (GP10)
MGKKNDLVFNDYYATHLNGGRRNNPAMNAQAMTEQMYIRILTELCANRFEWTGLPDSVNPRYLEVNLTWRALAVFYKDPDTDKFFAAQGAPSGAVNFMDEPTSYTIIGPTMQPKRLNAMPSYDLTPTGDTGPRKDPECVPIWANYMRTPDLDVIHLYAHKLAKLDRSIEITADNMRKTKVIAAGENERLSAMNALKSITQGDEAIFVTDGGASMISNMQVLDLGVDPLTLPNLQIAKSKMWNECMGLLGINNSNQDKKERLVAAEVGANDEQVAATRNIALNARQYACEQINALYGQNISVDFKQPPPPPPADTAGTEPVTGGAGSQPADSGQDV